MRVITENNEIVLAFSKDAIDISEVQSFIEYIKFREINSQSKASQDQADQLSDEINQSWWDKNKHRFES